MEEKTDKFKAGKFIDFIITQKCTYKCAYCSQSKRLIKDKNDASKKTIKSFLNFLDKIDKDFEITITGGEALLHPDFFDLIEQIKQKGFKINLITNLSFDIEKYNKVFSVLNDSLNRFDISFHLNEIEDFNLLIEKLKKILEIKPNSTQTVFLIPIFNLDNEKEEKIENIKNIAKQHSIQYDFQHIHFFDKYRTNSESEQNLIKNKPFESYSHLCFAGNLSAVIYENGEVYRCYSSRFLKSNHLGNINDKNFKLNNCANPCPMKFCTCPKPKNYNQITDIIEKSKANYLKILNMLFFPYYFLKNIKIVNAKIKQLMKNR